MSFLWKYRLPHGDGFLLFSSCSLQWRVLHEASCNSFSPRLSGLRTDNHAAEPLDPPNNNAGGVVPICYLKKLVHFCLIFAIIVWFTWDFLFLLKTFPKNLFFVNIVIPPYIQKLCFNGFGVNFKMLYNHNNLRTIWKAQDSVLSYSINLQRLGYSVYGSRIDR